MQRAAEHYASRLETDLSRSIRYRREDAYFDIACTIGNTPFTVTDSDGLFHRDMSRDFLIVLAQWPSVLGEPERGDIIEELNIEMTVTHVYQVASPGSEPVWRWSDDYRRVYRIHTKEARIR